MEVEDRWKWKRDRSTANCKKSVQSCIEPMLVEDH